MKKKILSTLLAVCLFVGMAIPAVFAASSDAAGDAKKVSKITVLKDTYEITVGDSKKFADQISVFENDTKLVLDHGHIQYSLLANVGDSSDFEISGDEVKALKAGATATLTIFDNYGEKARTSVKIKSVAGTVASTKKIESYTFENSLYTLPVGTDAEKQTIVVESHPKGTKFTHATANEAVAPVIATLASAGIANVTGAYNKDKNKVELTIPAASLTGLSTSNVNKPIEVKDTNFVNGKEFKATTALRLVTAIKATGVSVPQDITVKVGETVDAPKVTYYPTNANVGKSVSWAIIPYINDGNAYQYATLTGDDLNKVLGVNSNTPAKARLQAILNGVTTTECIVNVKPATFAGTVTPFISKSSGELKVGGVMALEVLNLPQGVTVKWSYDSKTTGIVDFAPWTGAKTNVYAKKAGTVAVKATLSNGEVYTANITVKAADVVKPGTTAPSTNPQTGDSLFANLF